MEDYLTTKELLEFYYKLMHDVNDRFFKSYAFFLALNAGIFGYFFSSHVSLTLRNQVLLVGFVSCSLFFLVSVVHSIWTFGIYNTIRKLLSKISKEKELEKMISIDAKKGWWLINTMSIGGNGCVLTIIIAYISLLFKN